MLSSAFAVREGPQDLGEGRVAGAECLGHANPAMVALCGCRQRFPHTGSTV